jgi:putative nucleotidyltransferase with HDIG domain
LDKVTALLQESPGLPRLLEVVLGAAQGLASAEAGRLVLLDVEPAGGALVEAVAGEASETLRGKHLTVGESLLLKTAVRGKPLRSSNPSKEEGYSPKVDRLTTSKPGFLVLPLVSGSLRGGLLLAGREGGFGPAEEADLIRFVRLGAVVLESVQARERALDSFTHTAELLVSFLEKADPGYPMHARSVAAGADMITAGLGRPAEEQLQIHFAALLHDIGKLGIDPAVLRMEGELNEDQRRLIQQHVTLGVQLISPISPWKELPRIIEAHHERWDGSGYPKGLKGNEIPFGARVVAVADAFDAISVKSPERTPEDVLAELQTAAFSQFDPVVIRVLEGEYRRRAALLKR